MAVHGGPSESAQLTLLLSSRLCTNEKLRGRVRACPDYAYTFASGGRAPCCEKVYIRVFSARIKPLSTRIRSLAVAASNARLVPSRMSGGVHRSRPTRLTSLRPAGQGKHEVIGLSMITHSVSMKWLHSDNAGFGRRAPSLTFAAGHTVIWS